MVIFPFALLVYQRVTKGSHLERMAHGQGPPLAHRSGLRRRQLPGSLVTVPGDGGGLSNVLGKLVGGLNHLEKYESQWEGLSLNVPNHHPDHISLTWIVGPFGDDFPKIIVIPGFGRTGFGRWEIQRNHHFSLGEIPWKSPGEFPGKIPLGKWSFHSSLGDLPPHRTVGLPKGTMFTNKYAAFMGFNSQIWWYNGIWPSQIMVILPTKNGNLYNGMEWDLFI